MSSPGARFWLGTSWKMTKTLDEACAYVDDLARSEIPGCIDTFILPPHTALATVHQRLERVRDLRGRPLARLGAQNAHWAPEGAVTGEVSMGMVRDAGATIVEIGHAERRTGFGETDAVVAAKVAAATRAGLTPLLCVGESRRERDAGRATAVVRAQLRAALADLRGIAVPRLLVAYEPQWAIGEGGVQATPDEVEDAARALRGSLDEHPAVRSASVLYGGSVDRTNASGLARCAGVDGLFVGRAAWSAAGLVELAGLCAVALRADTEDRAVPCSVGGRPFDQEEI